MAGDPKMIEPKDNYHAHPNPDPRKALFSATIHTEIDQMWLAIGRKTVGLERWVQGDLSEDGLGSIEITQEDGFVLVTSEYNLMW